MYSYLCRQNWLQKNQAAHVVNLLSGAMPGGQSKSPSAPAGSASISADELFAEMGIEIETS